MAGGHGSKWEEAGHVASRVRKEREKDVDSHLAFFLCSVQGPSPWDSTAHIQDGSSLLNTLTGTPRTVS